jgi:hypothetical protein
MQNKDLKDFVKIASLYAEAAGGLVQEAVELVVNQNKKAQDAQQHTEGVILKLASLPRRDGTPFLPAGMEKQAADTLSSHSEAMRVLSCVLDEYDAAKQDFDSVISNVKQGSYGTPVLGGFEGSSNKNVLIGSYESTALDRSTQLLLQR